MAKYEVVVVSAERAGLRSAIVWIDDPHEVYVKRGEEGAFFHTPTLGKLLREVAASLVFDPRNLNHYFVVRGGRGTAHRWSGELWYPNPAVEMDPPAPRREFQISISRYGEMEIIES